MSKDVKQYRVFIASPAGLDKEREGFRDTLRDYNEMDAVERGVLFSPVGWEETLGGIGRPQSIINDEVISCDYFIMVLWDRWGSSPHMNGKGKYSSGTEEEYHIALECLADKKTPMRQIVVFFKAVDERMLSDPGEQLKKVLEFKRKLEAEKTLLFHTYDEVESFKKLITKYLAQWVRDHESGETGKPAKLQVPPQGPPVGVEEVAPVEREILTGEQAGMSDKIKEAWRLADEGRLTDAETRFAELVVSGMDADALNNYGRFLLRIGRVTQAKSVLKRAIEIAEGGGREEAAAIILGNLGIIEIAQGNLDEAEQMLKRSLEVSEKLRRLDGMANAYGNLGIIYSERGDLDKSEEMLTNSLEIEEKLGRLESIANAYGNLGVIYLKRGDLDKAEQMHTKALKIDEELGRLEGVATDYGNLGLIYGNRGDLAKAEQMHTKALKINEKLGRLDGVASGCGNLGVIYDIRGDLVKAEQMFTKSLEINEKLGRLEGMASQYGNLGITYLKRSDLDKAEQMLKKSHEINEKLGRLEGVANQYANLGSVYEKRGDTEMAREYWEKALELFKKIGMKPEIEKTQQAIDGLKDK